MAKFKNLRYRDGLLNIGGAELKVDKSDLSKFIQGIATLNTSTINTHLCSISDISISGGVVDNCIRLHVSVPNRPQVVTTISSNRDSFKDKKSVEVSVLIFRIIQYLSQFL